MMPDSVTASSARLRNEVLEVWFNVSKHGLKRTIASNVELAHDHVVRVDVNLVVVAPHEGVNMLIVRDFDLENI